MAPKKIKLVLNSERYLAGRIHRIIPLVKVGNTIDPAWGILVTLDNIPNNGPIWPLSRYQYFRLGYLRYNPWPHSFFHASPYRFPFNRLFGETENSGSASCFACTKVSYRHELVHVVKM